MTWENVKERYTKILQLIETDTYFQSIINAMYEEGCSTFNIPACEFCDKYTKLLYSRDDIIVEKCSECPVLNQTGHKCQDENSLWYTLYGSIMICDKKKSIEICSNIVNLADEMIEKCLE